MIATSKYYVGANEYCLFAGLRKNGKVVICDNRKDKSYPLHVQGWRDIVSIAIGYTYSSGPGILGLKNDGKVIISGLMADYYDVQKGDGIVSLGGSGGVIGLRKDGTVLEFKKLKKEYGWRYIQCDHTGWKDIIQISRDGHFGLKKDGTVVAACSDDYAQEVLGWKNIISIDSNFYGYYHAYALGITKDGTLAHTKNYPGSYNYQEIAELQWEHISAISCGQEHFAVLLENGKVVAAGKNDFGQCEVNTWRDVIAIKCGSNSTMAIKRDGSVLYTGELQGYRAKKGVFFSKEVPIYGGGEFPWKLW